MVDLLLDNELVKSQEELRSLISNDVKSFDDLCTAAHKEPKLLVPVLNRYITWFNTFVVPQALRNIGA